MEELDLSNSKWNPENEIYILSIIEGIKDNYPDIDLDKELAEINYKIEDLSDPNKIKDLMKILYKKYSD